MRSLVVKLYDDLDHRPVSDFVEEPGDVVYHQLLRDQTGVLHTKFENASGNVRYQGRLCAEAPWATMHTVTEQDIDGNGANLQAVLVPSQNRIDVDGISDLTNVTLEVWIAA